VANLAVPVMRTFTVGEYETGAYFNSNVRDAMNFVTQPPIFNAVQATAGTISSTLWTPLPLDSTIVDSYGGHSNTTNNAQYVAQVAGWCLVTAAVCWASNATGWRGIRILHNSNLAVSGSATEVSANASGVTALATPSVIVYLNVGDYVQGEGYQTSGGSLSTSVNVDANCALTVFWLHS
jgi:hypothetical protein